MAACSPCCRLAGDTQVSIAVSPDLKSCFFPQAVSLLNSSIALHHVGLYNFNIVFVNYYLISLHNCIAINKCTLYLVFFEENLVFITWIHLFSLTYLFPRSTSAWIRCSDDTSQDKHPASLHSLNNDSYALLCVAARYIIHKKWDKRLSDILKCHHIDKGTLTGYTHTHTHSTETLLHINR